MRNILLAAACAASLALAGCATTGSPGSAHLDQGKAISAGWSSLKFAADTADGLVLSGKLKGADAGKVSADLKQAQIIMTAADQTYRTNSAVDLSSQIAAAAALAAEILTITTQHQ